MGKRQREKPCDRCLNPAAVLYRVQVDASRRWQFVCPACWAIVSADNPHYVYGGTWKASKG